MRKVLFHVQSAACVASVILVGVTFVWMTVLFFMGYSAQELARKLVVGFTNPAFTLYWSVLIGYGVRIVLLRRSQISNRVSFAIWFASAIYILPTILFSEPMLERSRWQDNPTFQQLYIVFVKGILLSILCPRGKGI